MGDLCVGRQRQIRCGDNSVPRVYLHLESSLSCPSSQVNSAASAAAVASAATAAASDTAAVAAAAAAAVTNSSFVLLASGSISQRLIEVNDSFTSKQFFFVCFFSFLPLVEHILRVIFRCGGKLDLTSDDL